MSGGKYWAHQQGDHTNWQDSVWSESINRPHLKCWCHVSSKGKLQVNDHMCNQVVPLRLHRPLKTQKHFGLSWKTHFRVQIWYTLSKSILIISNCTFLSFLPAVLPWADIRGSEKSQNLTFFSNSCFWTYYHISCFLVSIYIYKSWLTMYSTAVL